MTHRDARAVFRHDEGAVTRRLTSIFGGYPERINERKRVYQRLLDEFEHRFGQDGPVTLVRAPARINLKGVHIDHRGGHTNYMAIDREMVMAVSPRDDDTIVLHDRESDRFGPRSFSISEALPPEIRGNWFLYIEQVSLVSGDWSNYVRAAVLRLQDHFKDLPLRGMNLLVDGNIPIAAGLSSSSALVVAACEACLQVNGLSLTNEEKTLLCGEAEWYIGTRGGAGDHAAMIFGRLGHLIRLRFFPLSIETFPFPAGYRVVVCNSLKQARKADGAKSAFNERVATYEIAMLMIKQAFPEYVGRLAHLRDLSTAHLGIDAAGLYRIVAALPECITREKLGRMLPAHTETLTHLFRSHNDPPKGYRVRAVCLFGLAECERSRLYADFLNHGDMETVGRLMYLSHDGDRVMTFDHDGVGRPWDNRITDEYLKRLIEEIRCGDQAREEAASLWRQSGGYGCSCEELDHLVDIARTVPGVIGANLTGAGLGGCVLAVVQETQVDALLETVNARYYLPRGLEPSTIVCTSVEGAGKVF